MKRFFAGTLGLLAALFALGEQQATAANSAPTVSPAFGRGESSPAATPVLVADAPASPEWRRKPRHSGAYAAHSPNLDRKRSHKSRW